MNKTVIVNDEYYAEPPSYLEVIEENSKSTSTSNLECFTRSFTCFNDSSRSGFYKSSIFDGIYIEKIEEFEQNDLILKISKLKEDNSFATIKKLRLF